MTYSVHLLSKNFARVLKPADPLTPQTLSWSCEGGPDEAVLQASTKVLSFKDWKEFLGHPVEIFNENGYPVWWGYINAIRQPFEPFTLACGLDGMSNSVAVRYTDYLGEDHLSPFASDSASQFHFGEKQLILDIGYADQSEALQKRDLALSRSAWPQDEIIAKGKSISVLAGIAKYPRSAVEWDSTERVPLTEGLPAADKVYLDCKGWFHTLSWKYYLGSSGVIGNTVGQKGTINLGYSATYTKLGQRFTPAASMDLSVVKFRTSKIGSPTDNLVLAIHADSAGLPSATALATVSYPASSIDPDSYGWHTAQFTTPVPLIASTPYWLVLSRSGALSTTAYYTVGLDESLAFTDIFRYHNGTSWLRRSPNAHLLFQLIGYAETTAQLQTIYASGNQFLTGFSCPDPSGVNTPPVDRSNLTCEKAFLDLLRLGNSSLTPLFATVNQQRVLSVSPQPPKQPQHRLTSQGVLTDLFNTPLISPHLAVGQWVDVFGKGILLLTQVNF